MKPKDLLILLLLTFAALLVHGYHPWAEDAEIYLPGVEKILQPELFPFNAQFFQLHAHATFFPNLIAASVRLSHLPLSAVLFCWQVACIFLLLLACWELAKRCFSDSAACWAGVALIAALLTLPVAGTALYILDQYINPRSFSVFLSVFAIVKVLDRRYLQAGLLLAFSAVIHPLMSAFALSYCVLVAGLDRLDLRIASLAVMFPFGLSLDPPSPAYHLVALKHPFNYLTRWHWYEWLGALAPLAILWGFSRLARRKQMRNVDLLCRALIIYELIYLPAALVLSIPLRLEALARLQPLRCLLLLYVIMFLVAGGFLAEYVLKRQVWRWLALFLPLCAGMFMAQRALFRGSAHIEWPWAAQQNQWAQAFEWSRDHTPTNAIFALDPGHLDFPYEDEQGFRAIAQRSRLADGVKDAGASVMFPALAEEWLRQTQAQNGWKDFQLKDFLRLRAEFGVSWVVVEQPGVSGLDCPYRNNAVLVCRVD